VPLLVDRIAAERLRRKMVSNWLIYSESLAANEIVAWLSQVARNDTGNVGLQLHVVAAAQPEHKLLAEVLGIDLGWKKKPGAPRVGREASQPLATETLSQVTNSLTKQEPSRSAIFVTHLPASVRAIPALSHDIRQFHELRRTAKPGQPSVLLFIRTSP
jgi:hypothetical protein